MTVQMVVAYMADQKIENLLELSLDVDENTREKSENLQVGYDRENKKWEVILRYTGDVEILKSQYDGYVSLLGGYGIVSVTRQQLNELS